MPIIEVPGQLRAKVEERIKDTPEQEDIEHLLRLIKRVVFDGHNVYLSTACLHGNHDYCNQSTRVDGTAKQPGQCKFCPSKCVCDCHI